MDALGAVSLAWEVSKDLYAFYRALKNCDTDIQELRAQICDLRSLSAAVSSILKRHQGLNIAPEHKVLVNSALADCEDAAKALKAVTERLTVDGISSRNAVSKLKVLGRRLLYPFQTETIAQLARDVREKDERLVRMDDKLAGNFARLERGLLDLNSFDRKNWRFDDVLVLLDRQAEISRSEADERRARAIVETLAHPHLRRRWEDVPNAPQSTFAWLLDPAVPKSAQASHLLSFLSTEHGLFWIRGRPASGKSTLMKFLTDTHRTDDVMKVWATDHDITIASHYFWTPGSTIQKSQQGMLQSLAHQVLLADLTLVPAVCRKRWEDRTIRGALEANPNSRSLLNGFQWQCLDSELWLRNLCPIHNESHGEVHVLLHGIVDKAQGNFLWVSLILGKLSPLLGFRPTAALRKIVNEFPSGLDEYFRRMIMDRIHTSLLSDTAMAIRIAMLENRLSYFWFLNIYTDEGDPVLANPQFSLVHHFTSFDSDDEIEAMNVKARALISTCCRDILTVGTRQPSRMLDGVSGDEYELDRLANLATRDTFVTFTHRTVFDFLRTPEMHRLLSKHVPPHFEDRMVAVHLEIAQWKLADPGRSLSAGGCGIALCEMLGYGASAGDAHLKLPGQLASIVENLAIAYLERTGDHAFSSSSTSGLLADNVKRLVCHLARYDLYAFARRVVKRDRSGRISFHRETPSGKSGQDPALLFFALGIQSKAGTHVELLRLLLQHPVGTEPNALHRSADEPGQRLREDDSGTDALHLQERALFNGIKPWILYKKYRKKGRDLRCVLESTKTTSTPWTDYGALETWGWQLTQDEEDSDYSHVQEQCTGVDLGDLSAGTSIIWDHLETTEHTTNGKQVSYYATNAEYINVFFPAAGVIMANVNYGPSYKTSHGLGSLDPWPKDAPLPKIKQWSDIVALTWLHLTAATTNGGSHQSQNLRWLFRRIIRNDDTQNVIGYVCKQKKVGQARPKGSMGPPWQAPVWPGLVVRPTESDGGSEGDFFNALLATPNANGIVWLLAQHREQLGWKTVKSIRVWSDLPSSVVYSPSMLLEIGDVVPAGE
ncbi:hypothetical protein KC323_g5135 [Hortaea werneckii]|nr:hypothetical protein KC323_g5135 [Hortaea werneckii]